MQLGEKTITIRVTPVDIAHGQCANRRQCVVAQALDRQFDLRGSGYIRVDANEFGVTKARTRYRYHPPRPMMTYLRKFDRLGKLKGLEEARELMEPASFICRLLSVREIPPKASPDRKKQVNAARRKRTADEKARGTYQRPQLRYVGV